jgi:hypothetical protein
VFSAIPVSLPALLAKQQSGESGAFGWAQRLQRGGQSFDGAGLFGFRFGSASRSASTGMR